MNWTSLIDGAVYRCKSKGVFSRKIVCALDSGPFGDVVIWTYLYAPSTARVKNGSSLPWTFAKQVVCVLPIELTDTNEACLRLRDWLSRGLNARYYYQKPTILYVTETDSFLIRPKYNTPMYLRTWENKIVNYEARR